MLYYPPLNDLNLLAIDPVEQYPVPFIIHGTLNETLIETLYQKTSVVQQVHVVVLCHPQ